VVDTLDQWELDLGVVELLDVHAARLGGRDGVHLDDLDGVGTGTVAGAHVAVALSDGTADGQVTVLAVHVVGARAGIVAQPDAEVLDLHGRRLVHLLDGHDLAGGLLELLQLAQEVPETGLGHDVVGSEDAHLVERRLGLLLAGQLAAHDLVLLQLQMGLGLVKMVLKNIVNKCGQK